MRALLLALAACTAPAATRAPARAPATVQALAIGDVVDVVTAGTHTLVFGRDAVHVVDGGAVGRRVDAPIVGGARAPWQAAAAFTGPDGARWVVAVAGGRLWRITPELAVEPADAQLGVGGARVLAVAAAARGFVVGLADGVAMSRDGRHLLRFAGTDVRVVAAARDRVAVARGGRVDVYDLAAETERSFPIAGASALRFVDAETATPRLVVLARGAVFAEERGALREVVRDARAIAVTGPRLWIRTASALLARDPAARVDVALPADARIFAAGARDLWLARGDLVRIGLPAGAREARWYAGVAPIVARVCGGCHAAGGAGALILDEPAQWDAHAPEIHDQLTSRAMPPPGVALADAERAALLRWLEAPSGP